MFRRTNVPSTGVSSSDFIQRELSLREVERVLELLGVDCCFQAVWNWKETLADHQSDSSKAQPSRVVVNEQQIEQIEIDAEKK
jgi:putative transposase